MENIKSLKVTCIDEESCDGVVITVINVESTVIECWYAEACLNSEIRTDSWNTTKLIMKEHSTNVKYFNGYGYNDRSNEFINLECNLENHYIQFNETNKNMTLSDLIQARYNSNGYLPCDGVSILCLNQNKCDMRPFPKMELGYHNDTCLYVDANDLVRYRCVGNCANSPTRPPTTNPTVTPTHSPTNMPTVPPTTMSPTESPTMAPTEAPTASPTRYPTENHPFYGYIAPNFIVGNLSSETVANLFNNPGKYVPGIGFMLSKAIFDTAVEPYGGNLKYYDYNVAILRLNDQRITDPRLYSYAPSNGIIFISTNITCNRDDDVQVTCYLILQTLQSHLDAFSKNAEEGLQGILDDYSLYVTMNKAELASLIVHTSQSPEPTTYYFIILISSIWFIIIVLSIVVVIYNCGNCPQCSVFCKRTDDAKWQALIKWGFQVCILTNIFQKRLYIYVYISKTFLYLFKYIVL